MKAGVDIALFIITVYDYFFNKGTQEDLPQPDNPYHADIENDTSMIGDHDDGFRRYKSVNVNNKRSLFAFEEDHEEEKSQDEKNNSAYYRRLANDELEQWQKEREN